MLFKKPDITSLEAEDKQEVWNMNVRTTPIAGVTVLEPDVFADPRGVFTPMFVQDDMAAVMGSRQILRVNHSTNRDVGTIRGFHLQLAPHEETKIVQCLRGKIYDVALDLRQNSPTYGHCYGEILDAESRRMLVIPEGFGHAFQTLEPDTDIMYFVTGAYAPDQEMNVNAVDAALPMTWPLPVTCRSEKDTTSPSLTDYTANGFDGVALSPQWQTPHADLAPDLRAAHDALARNRQRTDALNKLLLHCRTMTLADAGSVYLIEHDDAQPQLRFVHAQNDSIDLDYQEMTLPCDHSSIAGQVAVTGTMVVIEDAYQAAAEGAYQFNQQFDREHGYHSKSMLVVPLSNRSGDRIGVLQLINRKIAKHHRLTNAAETAEHVLPFSQQDIERVCEWTAQPIDGDA